MKHNYFVKRKANGYFDPSTNGGLSYESDEAMEDCGYLKYVDTNLQSAFIQNLNTMRKCKMFCDVILNVENMDIHAHRNVLASVSPYLMELFSTSAEQGCVSSQNRDVSGGGGATPNYRLNHGITKEAITALVDYAYSSILEVPDSLVKDVYHAAWRLRMERVAAECARHLIAELTADTSIETRSLPGINRNLKFVKEVDTFIDREFVAVSQTAAFLQLPIVTIDVLYQTKQEMALVMPGPLCRLVFEWVRRQLTEDTLSMNQLLERLHMLYLALDNSLQDCSDLPPGHCDSQSDLIQDYKRLVLKCPSGNKSRRKCLAAADRPRVLLYSQSLGTAVTSNGVSLTETKTNNVAENPDSNDADWDVIGSSRVAENTFVAIATLDGQLTRLSVKLRINTPASGVASSACSSQDGEEMTRLSNGHKSSDSLDKLGQQEDVSAELFCSLAVMSAPKCGHGATEFQGRLFVCGGYDRGDCLRAVESYDPVENCWVPEPPMNEARGRVQIAQVGNAIFAVGGSNGTHELDTIECLKTNDEKNKWRKCKRLPLARSNAGVCAQDGLVYCVGGWNGQSGIRQCDVYHPDTDEWSSIAPLITGRYQAGVTSFEGHVWAVGGSDAWNCLASAERYGPSAANADANLWQPAPPLMTARRGCGLAAFGGRLWAVGGSDGSHALNTTEVYDTAINAWRLGPSMTMPRSNVAVAVVGDRLYAVGGFTGKNFINTIEYLDAATDEWTTFAPQSAQLADTVVRAINGGINGHQLDAEAKKDVDTNGLHLADDKKIGKINGHHLQEEVVAAADDIKGSSDE